MSTEKPVSKGRRHQLAVTFVNKLLHESEGLITLQTIEALTDSGSTKSQTFWRDIGITLRVANQALPKKP